MTTSSGRGASDRPPISQRTFGEIALNVGILSQLFPNRIAQLLEPHALSYNQLTMLSHLEGFNEPTTISDITSAMEINQPGVTKMVKRLEENGLVSISDDAEDRRVRRVSLSEAGAQLLVECRKSLGPDVATWFGSWSVEEIEQFRQLSGRLVHWLDQHRLPSE